VLSPQAAPLAALDRDEVAAMAASILGETPSDSVLELSAQVAGTPSSSEALSPGLVDTGALVRSEGGCWPPSGDRAATLPRGVPKLLLDRLDLPAPDERSIAELVAHGAPGLPHDIHD
jgi:hypothetical protein